MTQEFKLREFHVPVPEPGPTVYALRHANKRLVNKRTGQGYDVPGGMTWTEICETVLKDGTNPGRLAMVARGRLKSTNGWGVTILD
jgi:hypothetical protein